MKIIQPEMGLLFLILPFVWAFWAITYRRRQQIRQRLIDSPVLNRISRLSSKRRDRCVLALSSIAVSFLIAALMRPQIEITHRVPEYEKQDLIVLLDRSMSMAAEDIPPSRFVRAKQEIRSFLLSKPEAIDRVGLVTFAGTSLILSQPTRDTGAILFYLDWIEEDPRPQYGTDIGAALESALEVTKKDRSANKKIYVLLSDGEDYGARLDQSLAAMRSEGARVHSIGIGSTREVPIPARIGFETVLAEDESGNPLTTTFNETTLRWVSMSTGGFYFRSTIGNELSAAIRHAVTEELQIREWKTEREHRDVYQWLILCACVTLTMLVPIFQ